MFDDCRPIAGFGHGGPGVIGKFENLADDEVSRVIDDVAIQVQDFVGPARVVQGITGNRPESVVLAYLVDRSGHRVASVDLGFGVPIRPAASSRRSVLAAGLLGRCIGDREVQFHV